jgi:hypothetical protein
MIKVDELIKKIIGYYDPLAREHIEPHECG